MDFKDTHFTQYFSICTGFYSLLFVLGLFAIKVLSNNLGWSSWKEHVHGHSHWFTFSYSSPQKQTGESTEADYHVCHSEAHRLHRQHSSLQETSTSYQGITQNFIINNAFIYSHLLFPFSKYLYKKWRPQNIPNVTARSVFYLFTFSAFQ